MKKQHLAYLLAVSIALASPSALAMKKKMGLLKKLGTAALVVGAAGAAYAANKHRLQPQEHIYAADCTPGILASQLQIDKVFDGRYKLRNMPVPVYPSPPNTIKIFAVFDGTNNHGESFVVDVESTPYSQRPFYAEKHNRYSADECLKYVQAIHQNTGNLIYTGLRTNPRILYELAITAQAPNVRPYYYRGVGTQAITNNYSMGSNVIDQFLGEEMVKNAHRAVSDIAQEVQKMLAEDPSRHFEIITTGFSRGAGSARIFHNLVLQNGLTLDNGTVITQPGEVPIAGSVLFDTVVTQYAKNQPADFSIPYSIPLLVHITAANEYRWSFKLKPAYNPNGQAGSNIQAVEFPGAHSDIGGSYQPDGISAATLEGATAVLQKMGIVFNEIRPEYRYNPLQSHIHDSRFVPNKPFLNELKNLRQTVE